MGPDVLRNELRNHGDTGTKQPGMSEKQEKPRIPKHSDRLESFFSKQDHFCGQSESGKNTKMQPATYEMIFRGSNDSLRPRGEDRKPLAFEHLSESSGAYNKNTGKNLVQSQWSKPRTGHIEQVRTKNNCTRELSAIIACNIGQIAEIRKAAKDLVPPRCSAAKHEPLRQQICYDAIVWKIRFLPRETMIMKKWIR